MDGDGVMQRRWEYANVYWDIEMADSLVKTIGRDGWELVSTERSDDGIIGFFKREILDNTDWNHRYRKK